MGYHKEMKKKLPYDFDLRHPYGLPISNELKKLLLKWKKERGYHILNNPGARHHNDLARWFKKACRKSSYESEV